jgi:mycothiol synthase
MIETGYTIRNYRPEDFDKYVLLCQESKELGPSGHPASPAMVRKWLNWPHYSPEKDLFFVEVAGELIGGIDLRPEPDINRIIIRCWVRPDQRRKGYGRALFGCAAQRAIELGIKCIHINIPGNNSVARTVLSRYGFKPIRRYLDLKLDMSAVSDREISGASGECRCLESGEEEALARIQNLAFEGQWGYHPNTPETIAFYTRLGNADTDNVILSCEDNKITGYCWLEILPGGKLGGEFVGEIHMIGTIPEYQGKGIGKKVLLAGLSYLRDRGVTNAYLSVDSENESALALYESVGFELHRKTLWYEKQVP